MGENPKAPKGWRPVAVVTSVDVADQWAKENDQNDWILLELDDLGLTGLADASAPFQPKQPDAPPSPQAAGQAEQVMKTQQETIQRLFAVVEQLADRKKDKDLIAIIKSMKTNWEHQGGKTGFSSRLLKKRQ
jgi:hypothetical protein